jgi:uncharacterized protein (DUF1330 family)
MAYVVVTIKCIKDQAAFQEYAEKVAPLIAKFSGQYLVSDRSPEVRDGEFPYARIVIVEFPAIESAQLWYASAEYQAIIPIRKRAFDANIIIARRFRR